jgi:hypothetical protein
MFGIRIEARPNAEEKQAILNAALESMRVGRQGVPLLGYSDYLMVQDFISKGMTKMARAYIANKEQQMMAKQDQEKQMAIEQQGQQNQMLQQQKGEQDQALFALEMEKIKLENEEKRITLGEQHEYKMAEIRLTQGMQVDTQSTLKAIDMQHEHDVMQKQKEQQMEQAQQQAALQQQQMMQEQQMQQAPPQV